MKDDRVVVGGKVTVKEVVVSVKVTVQFCKVTRERIACLQEAYPNILNESEEVQAILLTKANLESCRELGHLSSGFDVES